ncbi:MAG TPA: RNA polymerase sigma factor [Actinomycetota bacterium]|nr:RNA polymerase sigma factor [Actinomycetota bacterium]
MEGRPLDDAELARRAKGGDVDAYERLVTAYQQIAFRTAYVITRDAAEAEDVTQEAFVRAFYALPRFRDGSPFRPWLLTIVANQARNRRRASGRRLELAQRAAEVRASGDAAPSPEAAALEDERHHRLIAALDSLREQERTAVALRYLIGLDEREMAEVMRCRPGTVKSRLSRGLDRLRDVLEGESI